mgnify:CR=1 FL=1|jgi:hypothetical protein
MNGYLNLKQYSINNHTNLINTFKNSNSFISIEDTDTEFWGL